MGLLVEFDVVNDFGYLDMTEEYQIIPDYTEGNEVFVETFLEIVKELVPVDTGYLRSTLEADYDDTGCWAGTDCEYAQYPEFGTWCQPAQPYFRPALEQALLFAQPFWDQAEEEALLEEEILLEEEALEEQAMALSREQGREYERAQAQAIRNYQGPAAFGGINFSSFGAFMGSVLGAFISAVIITSVQAMLGKDFTNNSSYKRIGGGGLANIYVPEILIT